MRSAEDAEVRIPVGRRQVAVSRRTGIVTSVRFVHARATCRSPYTNLRNLRGSGARKLARSNR